MLSVEKETSFFSSGFIFDFIVNDDDLLYVASLTQLLKYYENW